MWSRVGVVSEAKQSAKAALSVGKSDRAWMQALPLLMQHPSKVRNTTVLPCRKMWWYRKHFIQRWNSHAGRSTKHKAYLLTSTMPPHGLNAHRSSSRNHTATSFAAQNTFPKEVRTDAVVWRPAPKPVEHIDEASSNFCVHLQRAKIDTNAWKQSKTRAHRRVLHSSKATAPSVQQVFHRCALQLLSSSQKNNRLYSCAAHLDEEKPRHKRLGASFSFQIMNPVMSQVIFLRLPLN